MVFHKCLHKARPFHKSWQPLKACLFSPHQTLGTPSKQTPFPLLHRLSSATPAGRGTTRRALATDTCSQAPPPEISPVCLWSSLDCPLRALLQKLPEAEGEWRKAENQVVQKLGEVTVFGRAGDSGLSTHPPSPAHSWAPTVRVSSPAI